MLLKLRNLILLIGLAGIAIACINQNKDNESNSLVPGLSIDQMLQDFDSLEFITKNIFQFSAVNKMVYGIDIGKIFKNNRKKIQGLKNSYDFGQLINQTINSCRGSHFWITSGAENDSVANAYYSYLKQEQNFNQMENAFFYFEGNYYTKFQMESFSQMK